MAHFASKLQAPAELSTSEYSPQCGFNPITLLRAFPQKMFRAILQFGSSQRILTYDPHGDNFMWMDRELKAILFHERQWISVPFYRVGLPCLL